MYEICMGTPLGGSSAYEGKEVTYWILDKKPAMLATLQPKTSQEVRVPGFIFVRTFFFVKKGNCSPFLDCQEFLCQFEVSFWREIGPLGFERASSASLKVPSQKGHFSEKMNLINNDAKTPELAKSAEKTVLDAQEPNPLFLLMRLSRLKEMTWGRFPATIWVPPD